MTIKIIAFADVHGMQYLSMLISSLNRINVKNVDFIVMAGDIVDKGRIEYMRVVLSVLQKLFPHIYSRPIVIAVFGNEEYFGTEENYYSAYPQVIWLNNSYRIVKLDDFEICFVGDRGVLKKPTTWQQRNIKGIENIYSRNLGNIINMVRACKKDYYTILITHYASSYLTIFGENPSIYHFLGYPIIEGMDIKPDIAIHGHAHNSQKTEANINGTAIYNVSIPANKGVKLITI
ncbi:MAG: metallophosphoesterase [Ignisphaera sp.]